MWNDCYDRGLMFVHQLFQGQQYKPFDQVQQEFGLTQLRYNSLLSAIPSTWRVFFQDNPKSAFMPIPPHKYDRSIITKDGLSRKIYKQLLEDRILLHSKYTKWNQELKVDINPSLYDFGQEFRSIYRVTNVPKYRAFQYRLLQRAVTINVQLYQWGTWPNSPCTFCGEEPETIIHVFFECTYALMEWCDGLYTGKLC